MQVIPNKKDETNKIAVGIQLAGLVLLAVLIQTIHNVAEDSLYEIVAILLGYGVVVSLAGVLFQYGNNRNLNNPMDDYRRKRNCEHAYRCCMCAVYFNLVGFASLLYFALQFQYPILHKE